MLFAERLRRLFFLALWKGGISFQVVTNVRTPPLHQMPRQSTANAFAHCPVQIRGKIREFLIK